MHPCPRPDVQNMQCHLHAVNAKRPEGMGRDTGKARTAMAVERRFCGQERRTLPIPDANGAVSAYVLGLGKGGDPLAAAVFSEQLEAGTYRLGDVPEEVAAQAPLAWILGLYSFARYRKTDRAAPKLVLPDGCRRRRCVAHRRRRVPRPRSHHHAGERHGPGRAGSGGARPGEKARREIRSDRRRCAAQGQLSADPHGRPRFGASAAAHRYALGPADGTESDAGRQRRVFRFRRARPQDHRRHADDEEGYGRRRNRARAGAHDHGCEARRASARAHSGCREFRVRLGLSSGRRDSRAARV